MIRERVLFDNLTPLYPNVPIRLETGAGRVRHADHGSARTHRQRAARHGRVAPKAGKTILLQKIANSITRNHPEVKLIVL